MVLLCSCGGAQRGTLPAGSTTSGKKHSNAASTFTFSPASITCPTVNGSALVTYSDSDASASLSSIKIADTNVLALFDSIDYTHLPNVLIAICTAAGSTTATFTDSDGNTGTLPVTAVAGPMDFTPGYYVGFDQKSLTQYLTVTESADATFTATSEDPSIVSVTPYYGQIPSAARRLPPLRLAGAPPASHAKHRPHSPATTTATYAVTSQDFGYTNIDVGDGTNTAKVPTYVLVPYNLVVDPQYLQFTAYDQQINFQVQEIGNVTLTATPDFNSSVVKIVSAARPRHIRRTSGVVVTTQDFTAESVAISQTGVGKGTITISDGTNSIGLDYAIVDVMQPAPPVMNFLGTGASNAQTLWVWELDGSPMTAVSSNPAVASITSTTNDNFYHYFVVQPNAPPSDGQPITITVTDQSNRSTQVQVNVTSTGGTINGRRGKP